MKIVIIVPTYNEAGAIEAALREIVAIIPDCSRHRVTILVVDDTSPDGTAAVVGRFAEKHPEVKLLLNKQKAGLGAAYVKAFAYVFDQLQAEAVVHLDADLSHPPQKIPEMIKKLEEGADLVVGTRYRKGGGIPADWGWHRKILSVGGNRLVRLVLGESRITDWTGGFKAFKKELYGKIRDGLGDYPGYTSQAAFNKMALDAGAEVIEVPFQFRNRTAGKSKMGAKYFFDLLEYVIKTRARELAQTDLFRVGAVGAVGFVVQTVFFQIFLVFMGRGSSSWAQAGSAELAVLANFALNNSWTFRRVKIQGWGRKLGKFLQFNLVSLGSIAIQWLTQEVGTGWFGEAAITVWLLYLTGVSLGLISNYFLYRKVVWQV